MTHYEFHPLSNIFPLIEGKEYQDLVADVRKNGVLYPIWLYEGKILDGRNRYRAAVDVGVECPVYEYDGLDPAGAVVSLNCQRRHLSPAQRAMAAAKLETLQHGQRADLTRDANLHVLPVTRADAAEMLNVSTRTVASAAKILAEAPQEVI